MLRRSFSVLSRELAFDNGSWGERTDDDAFRFPFGVDDRRVGQATTTTGKQRTQIFFRGSADRAIWVLNLHEAFEVSQLQLAAFNAASVSLTIPDNSNAGLPARTPYAGIVTLPSISRVGNSAGRNSGHLR